MKALPIQVSSPSNADKFTPPLKRPLRSEVGSKSRGKGRAASPLFHARSAKKNDDAAAETVQEPSSPKVTCFGQVRVRRSARAGRRDRRWFKKFREGEFPGLLSRWVLFCRSGYCNKVDAREDSFRVNSNSKGENSENYGVRYVDKAVSSDSEVEDGEKCKNLESKAREREKHVFSPPKNALILTRCRSAPFRSSSLAARIWGTPYEYSDQSQVVKTENEAQTEFESKELQNPSSENVVKEAIIGAENVTKLDKIEDLKSVVTELGVHALLPTRCKSVPARVVEGLSPADSSWRRRRLDNVGPT